MYRNIPLVSLGPLPPGFREELGEDVHFLAVSELAETDAGADLQPFLDQLEILSQTLPDGPILVLCPHGCEAMRRLDDALARLFRQDRHLHLVHPLSFGFEGHSSLPTPEVLRLSRFLCRSITFLDGRSLMSRLPEKTTLSLLFRIEAAKLAHLLSDLCQVLASPRNTRIYRSLAGEFRWEGTWPSSANSTEHLACLIRAFESPHLSLVVSRGASDPQRLLRMPRRLGIAPFLLCRSPADSPCRLGALIPVRNLYPEAT